MKIKYDFTKVGQDINPMFNYGWAVIAELVSAVQGGDSESNVDSVFVRGYMSNQDRTWGKFNYKKREPGSRVILKIFENNSYCFTYATRDYEEIQRLANN